MSTLKPDDSVALKSINNVFLDEQVFKAIKFIKTK